MKDGQWEPKPARCGPCGLPSTITYRKKGIYVEQLNTCQSCGWAYGGLAHILGNLLRWDGGPPEEDVYPEVAPKSRLYERQLELPL